MTEQRSAKAASASSVKAGSCEMCNEFSLGKGTLERILSIQNYDFNKSGLSYDNENENEIQNPFSIYEVSSNQGTSQAVAFLSSWRLFCHTPFDRFSMF